MKAFMEIRPKDGLYHVCLAYKLFEDSHTPLRHLIDVVDTNLKLSS